MSDHEKQASQDVSSNPSDVSTTSAAPIADPWVGYTPEERERIASCFIPNVLQEVN